MNHHPAPEDWATERQEAHRRARGLGMALLLPVLPLAALLAALLS